MFRSLTAFALLAMAPVLHAEAVKRYVTLDGTRLLSKPSAFSPSLGTLAKGRLVSVEPAKNGYFKVTVDGKTGYLHGRALQASRPKIGATAKKSGDASSEEVAAATKGFNKQMEADRRKESKLDYDLLDKLEERTKVENPAESLDAFQAEGKLGGHKEDGK